MPETLTPRQLAKAQNIERIKELALRQLATEGAASLSLRAIARELNLVSSAIYRYYASRDDLITALILDAYDDLADALETAGDTRRGARGRWVDTCLALRAWAVAAPHRFALIYGSAIPGYAAPADTIVPAARVVRALGAPVVADGFPAVRRSLARPLAEQLRTTAAALELDLPPSATLALVEAFAHLVGALTLELNGHFVGGFEPADALFAALVEDTANTLGL
ncbi:MAG TPA: TetR/AcrR family transcriptional regulator [Nocardioides sp.]|jgi:AcrR family transcriptional regulator|uniref:TetR/AcrR family transcriptional regulator n=1 Tax=Nocardioides sp. TaxID=35761 RepID=UPI002C3DFFCD|nr:TetR/AcrR family transcriptional regulator [Nocardioides sp.]HTW17137.1 TetR/AcrR family transcriptional regulator [Nocardioides sp.]